MTVEEYCERLKEKLEKKQYDRTAMWKLMIPSESKCELYDYINLKNDNAASMFLGYCDVVQCLVENNEFDRIKKKRDLNYRTGIL